MADAISVAPTNGDYDRGPEFIRVAWIECSIAIIFVALRFYSRIKYVSKLWWDDWVMLLTLALVISYSVLWTIYSLSGGGRHVYYLSPEERVRLTRLNWVSQPPVIIALATGKISVAFLILRILGPGSTRWLRNVLYFIMWSSIGFSGLAVIIQFVQCSPVQKLWDTNLEGHCWNPLVQTHFTYFVGSYLALMDFILAGLPIFIIWNLRLDRQRKVGVAIILGLGVFAGICAAIKTSQLGGLSARSDFTSVTVTLLVWNGNEILVIIIAACIPTLRPLFLDVVGRFKSIVLTDKSKPSSSGTTEQGSYQLKKYSAGYGSRRLRSQGSSQDAMCPGELADKSMAIKQTTVLSVGYQPAEPLDDAVGLGPSPPRRQLRADDRV